MNTTTIQDQRQVATQKCPLCELTAQELEQQCRQLDQEIRSLRAKTGHVRKLLNRAKADLAAAQQKEATLMAAAQVQETKPQETIQLNESNGILYGRWHGCYAAITNPDGKRRTETYQVLKAVKVRRDYFLMLGEKVVQHGDL